MKRTPLRKRSKAKAKLYREERVPLVERLLDERPWCERCSVQWGNVRSTVIHEKRLRSAGGSITDEENCVALCGTCHLAVHSSPAQARKDGWITGRFGS